MTELHDQENDYIEDTSVVLPVDKLFESEPSSNKELHILNSFLVDEVFTSRLKNIDQGNLIAHIQNQLASKNYDDNFVYRCNWFLHMLSLCADRELEYYIERFTNAIKN